MNIAAAYEVLGKMVMHFGGAEAYSEFRQEMTQQQQFGLTMADVLGKSSDEIAALKDAGAFG